MEPLEAQRELLEITIELQRLDQRLHELAVGLPRPAEQDRMLEGDLPSDVGTELQGVISFGQDTQLRPLIASLSTASTVTDDDLRLRFRRRQLRLDRMAAERPAPEAEVEEEEQPAASPAKEADGC